MAITADFHLHSSHSGDSATPMEDMIRQGLHLGLTHMCFTEHNDFDFPLSSHVPENIFLLEPDPYLYDVIRFREKYADRINILFGVELGLQLQSVRKNAVLAKSYDFDFIIGSAHVCDNMDPYYPEYYEGRTEEEAYGRYFQSILENIKKFSNFDILGHLDYVVRYGPTKDANYSYEKYSDILDAILKHLIENGKGIEINTGGVKSGLKELHPCTAVIKRFRELGGEIITIGSDAHKLEQLATYFDRAEAVLTECGFRYYTVFEKRIPEFRRL